MELMIVEYGLLNCQKWRIELISCITNSPYCGPNRKEGEQGNRSRYSGDGDA